jgi:hypothetical protein
MQFHIIMFVVVLMSISGAVAQTSDAASSAGRPIDVEHEHPEWFKETYTYKPCPAAVVFGHEHHACLGFPTVHYGGKVRLSAYRTAGNDRSYYRSGCSCGMPQKSW